MDNKSKRPLVKGGQGRSDKEMEDSAAVIAYLALAFLGLAFVLCWVNL